MYEHNVNCVYMYNMYFTIWLYMHASFTDNFLKGVTVFVLPEKCCGWI